MRLTVLGMSGSFPGPDSPASGYLLEADHEDTTYRMLVDLGSGALGSLQRHIDLDDIDSVLLSHLHADHCLDMCGLYVARKYYGPGAAPRIPVYGPPGTADRLARAYDLPPNPGMTREFAFHEFPAGPFSVGPFTVTATRVVHPVAAFALRVESGGRVLAYSGDTGPCPALEQVAADADLFLCEASFLEGNDNPPDLHLTGRQAAEHASRARVGRLLLTHIPPVVDLQRVLDDAKPAFDGQVDLAETGSTYSL